MTVKRINAREILEGRKQHRPAELADACNSQP